MKIVILDGHSANPGDLSWKALEEFGELTVYDRTSKAEIVERTKDANAILTNKVALREEVLEKLPNLKYIGVLATGYNIIDTAAATARGITVCNVPAYSTSSVAQMVFAYILTITNRVEHYTAQIREGEWSRKSDFCYWDTPLRELSGKTIGIVGLGDIGYRVACIAHYFGMDVYAFTSKNAPDLPEYIRKTTMDGLLAASDILTLHCPLTASTRELIDESALERMKRGAILINTARGPLVNEQAVAAALQSGQLAAYGADVMCAEPPAADNPLLVQPNAYLTPHVAWASIEVRTRLVNIAVENMRAFVDGAPQNVVNR